METQKFDFFLQKSSKLNLTCILTCAEELKSTFKKVSTCTSMSTSGMHRRPFEGRHLVSLNQMVACLNLSLLVNVCLQAKSYFTINKASLLTFVLFLQTGSKKDAEKLVKYIIKIIMKIGILARNDQFTKDDVKVADQVSFF